MDNFSLWYQIPNSRILIYPIAYEDLVDDNKRVIKVLALKDRWQASLFICYGYVTDGYVRITDATDGYVADGYVTDGYVRVPDATDGYVTDGHVQITDVTDGNILEFGEAKADLISAEQYSMYDAYFINCPCNGAKCFENLAGISVLPKSNERVIPKEPMARIKRMKSGKIEQNFTVCVSPIFDYLFASQLELFLKYYRSHGVSKFVFYYQNSSIEVEQVLQKFQTSSFFGAEIELILWPNPAPSVKLSKGRLFSIKGAAPKLTNFLIDTKNCCHFTLISYQNTRQNFLICKCCKNSLFFMHGFFKFLKCEESKGETISCFILGDQN